MKAFLLAVASGGLFAIAVERLLDRIDTAILHSGQGWTVPFFLCWSVVAGLMALREKH